jgi:hypothetical protein
LPWKVKKNATSQLWVASIQTSQKAVESKDPLELKQTFQLFIAPSQEEAYETGLAMTPPLMMSIEMEMNPVCFLCQATGHIYCLSTSKELSTLWYLCLYVLLLLKELALQNAS